MFSIEFIVTRIKSFMCYHLSNSPRFLFLYFSLFLTDMFLVFSTCCILVFVDLNKVKLTKGYSNHDKCYCYVNTYISDSTNIQEY